MKIRNLLRKMNFVSIGLEKVSDYSAYEDASQECRFHGTWPYTGNWGLLQMVTSFLAHPFFGDRISKQNEKYNAYGLDDF